MCIATSHRRAALRFCAAAPPNENRSLSCGFAATSAVSTNEIATFIAACTRVQYRYKNRAKICTSPQHVPLHLVALKFTHRLPQCYRCTALYRAAVSAAPTNLKLRPPCASVAASCCTSHCSCAVSLNKTVPPYCNASDKNRTEIYVY